jgi:AraC-like DNA-binding protein
MIILTQERRNVMKVFIVYYSMYGHIHRMAEAVREGRAPVVHVSEFPRLRINHAVHLLRHSNQSITEIAFEVGFNDSNYFSRQFAKEMGVGPRAYRQQFITR